MCPACLRTAGGPGRNDESSRADRPAQADHAASAGKGRLTSLIAAGPLWPGAVVAGPFDAAGVVAASFDDPRGRSGPGVRGRGAFAGDVIHDRGEDTFLVLRGRDHADYQEDNTERHPLETSS